jgi:hypothetical protein
MSIEQKREKERKKEEKKKGRKEERKKEKDRQTACVRWLVSVGSYASTSSAS